MAKYIKAKKIITYFFIIILCFGLTSCKNGDIVNDTETGEIETGEIKYNYVDGTYLTISEFYNNEGYAYAMKVTVKDGIINSVCFDMLDRDLNRFSQTKDENLTNKAEIFKAEVKALTTTLLQNQTSMKIVDDEKYSYAFKMMANITIENAQTGNTEISFADLKEEYDQTYTNPDTNITSNLKVVYNHGIITNLEFKCKNEFNTLISNYNYDNSQEIPITYKELMNYLNEIPQDELTLKKDNPTDYPLIEVHDYNHLCDIINSIRKEFTPDYSSLFSSL